MCVSLGMCLCEALSWMPSRCILFPLSCVYFAKMSLFVCALFRCYLASLSLVLGSLTSHICLYLLYIPWVVGGCICGVLFIVIDF